MLGAFLKLPVKLVKLQVKLALLPARLALRALRRLLDVRSGPGDEQGTSSWDPVASARPDVGGSESTSSPGTMALEPSELMERLNSGDELVLIDVRQAEELASNGLIEGALHIPSQDLPHRIEDLDKAQPTVVYCHLGGRSMDAAMFLLEKGFSDVKSLGGGIVGWQSDGGEVAYP